MGITNKDILKTVAIDVPNMKEQLESNANNHTYEDKGITFANELINQNGWNLGVGWSGDFDNGFTHTKGNTQPLTFAIQNLGTKIYQVEVTVESPTSTMASNSGWEISLGGSVGFEMYEGNFTTHTYNRGIQALGGADLVIKPQTGFDGTIKSVSIKEILGLSNTTHKIKENENTTIEFNPTSYGLENVYCGRENATKNTTGNRSIGFGVRALKNNTTGFWNVALGYETLMANTVGSRNIAIGYIALNSNVSGHRNVVLGSFAMHDNKDGHNNIALGADCLQRNIDGNYNFGVGVTSLSNNTSGSHNIGIGKGALIKNQASGNIGFGEDVLQYNVDGIENIVIGQKALKYCVESQRNIVVGNNTFNNTQALNNIRNIVIGVNAFQNAISGANYNVAIGHNVGTNITTGNNNILIGYNVDTNAPTDSYQMNIGNLLYGRLSASNLRLGIGVSSPLASLHLPAGKSSQFGAPLRFTQGSLLASAERGAIEYDGNNLYFTTESGTRMKFQLVAV